MIEVDGSVHDTQADHDKARTEHLKNHGYSVLRFTNDEITNHLPDVLNTIRQTITRLKSE